MAPEEPVAPATVPILAGLISVADWIGSNTDYFPFDSERGPADYFRESDQRVRFALAKTGWLPKPVYAAPLPFEKVFTSFPPNDLQKGVAELVDKQTGPFLLAVEAQMGQGKTEAALYAVDSSLCGNRARGLYVALPTQATSNAMFSRVRKDYLAKRGHSNIDENFQLVHGNALLDSVTRVSGVGDSLDDDSEAVAARSWFTARKRPLLAPFGVGTIDQALLGVLQTRHWFVRLFGLANKVVVFDEVHAYDTYTSTLLDRLIEWLSALRCTVILLSATLPYKRLSELVRAYSGRELGNVPEYPRITLAGRSESLSVSIDAKGEQRVVSLEFESGEPSEVAQLVSERLFGGGCVAVICNTVDRAQNVREAICKKFKDELDDCELILFHARTPFGWRKAREDEVLRKFGKPNEDGRSPDRPFKAVVIATQVIEQSLDLDFDWILTDMAPIDLLLQRLGREHRHHRGARPPAFQSPTFTILSDGEVGGAPPGFGSAGIYERYTLLRSWLAIAGKSHVTLPDDIDQLVQWVYGDEEVDDATPEWKKSLSDGWKDMENRTRRAREDAEGRVIPKPDKPTRLVRSLSAEMDEDDNPATTQALRALTRDADPSIRVVCLIRRANELRPACADTRVDLQSEPNMSLAMELINSSLSIQKKGRSMSLRGQDPPAGWKKSPHLRYHRAVEFVDGTASVGRYCLELSEDLGLVIRGTGAE